MGKKKDMRKMDLADNMSAQDMAQLQQMMDTSDKKASRPKKAM